VLPGNGGDACPPPEVVSRVSAALRNDHVLWMRVTAHLLPAVGSIATELVVLLDGDNTPCIPLRGPANSPPSKISTQLRAALVNKGYAARPSAAMVAGMLAHIHDVNAHTVALCHTIIAHSNQHVIVLRLALKPVMHVDVNPATHRVWFCSGHANVVVINTITRAFFVLEPTGAGLVRRLAHTIAGCLLPVHGFHLYHNLGMPGGFVQPVNDRMCTVWCALLGMVLLANPVVTEDEFWALLEWTREHRVAMLRAFFLLTCAHMVGPGP
jgi:hypothetical protein